MKMDKRHAIKKDLRQGSTEAIRHARFAATAKAVEKRLGKPARSAADHPSQPGRITPARIAGLARRTARMVLHRTSG